MSKAGKPCNKFKSIERKANYVDIRILSAGKGYLLGHEDVINDRNYTTSVKCISLEGSVFEIKAEEFLSNMSKMEKSFNYLLQLADERDKMTKGKIISSS